MKKLQWPFPSREQNWHRVQKTVTRPDIFLPKGVTRIPVIHNYGFTGTFPSRTDLTVQYYRPFTPSGRGHGRSSDSVLNCVTSKAGQ